MRTVTRDEKYEMLCEQAMGKILNEGNIKPEFAGIVPKGGKDPNRSPWKSKSDLDSRYFYSDGSPKRRDANGKPITSENDEDSEEGVQDEFDLNDDTRAPVKITKEMNRYDADRFGIPDEYLNYQFLGSVYKDPSYDGSDVQKVLNYLNEKYGEVPSKEIPMNRDWITRKQRWCAWPARPGGKVAPQDHFLWIENQG